MEHHLDALIAELTRLPEAEQVTALNHIRTRLHQASPFRDEPVDLVLWVPEGDVQANDYNPNTVAKPEMKLLEVSILADGYTQPIVTFVEGAHRTVVDGFHRSRVGRESTDVKARVRGYLPVTSVRPQQQGREERMASTIRHNRARGKHGVEAMMDIVTHLAQRNWGDEKIARELGMDADEVLRYRQIGGLAAAFQDEEFSEAWEVA